MDQWNLKPAGDLGLPMGQRLRSVRRERGSLPWAAHLASWSLVSAAMHLWHRLKIQGREQLPAQGSFVLAANHCSHLDTLALACALPWRRRPDAFPIAAGDTFFKTRMSAVVAALFINALPMWRRGAVSHSLADLRARLIEHECVLIIFPEGTRSRDGKMGQFKSGLGMIIAQTAIPVVPCRLWGTFQSLPPGRRIPRPSPVRLSIGRPLRFDATSNDRPGWDQIAGTVQGAVSALE